MPGIHPTDVSVIHSWMFTNAFNFLQLGQLQQS